MIRGCGKRGLGFEELGLKPKKAGLGLKARSVKAGFKKAGFRLRGGCGKRGLGLEEFVESGV